MKNRTTDGLERVPDFLGHIEASLREFGISIAPQPGDGVDAAVVLSRGEASATYSLQVTDSMTLTALDQWRLRGERPLLVAGTHIGRRSADAFRQANIQFVDLAGNAFIAFDGVYVDVRGRAESDIPVHVDWLRTRARHPSNLFSRGRAQVILALLAWPELVGARRREIASAAGVSLGQTHDALTKLVEAGFLLPRSSERTRFDELLDLWSAAYSTGLGPHLALAQFSGDPARPLKTQSPIYLSGEAADGVDVSRPAALTFYLEALDPKLAIANRWSTNPDRISNVFVRRKFWTSPRPEEDTPEMASRNAPWPLVYADLMATGDPRLAEVARTWRRRHARFVQD